MLSSYHAQQDLIVIKNNIQDMLLYLNKIVSSGMIEIKKTYCFILSSRYGIIDNIELYNYVNSLVTTYDNGRQSIVSSSDISINGIQKSINQSVNIVKYTQIDKNFGLPHYDLLFKNKKKINLFFPHVFNLDEIKDLVNKVDSSALRFDSKIINTEGSTFEYFINVRVLGNSFGWIGTYLSTYYCLSSCVVAGHNESMERDFFYTVSRDFYDLDDPERVGCSSAKKSLSKLHSRKIHTQISPVIFISDIAYKLFSYLVSAIQGYSVYKKSTFLLNFLNKKIFPSWLDISENPFLEKGLSSRLFDGEGVATVRRKIVEKGILKTWLLDTYTANQLKMNSTGHSGGICNWIVSGFQENCSFSELLITMNRGLLVTELLGDGVNIVTGNYSRGACGFWIEGGKIKYPVHEITISGNLLDMWNNISLMSNDVNKKNNIHSSSVLIDKMQISGN
ncbi:metalloprotease PmbA [Buchnera aphidicola]|uniref:Metalloprotease PmbA n=1 Tax=Buchnera aphidicola (Cinara strobi) TaxID=1921549 RepID=A0A3B1E016_9GAMM|nr:metalloprotease PmbA [Buchnera aphidicola]VAX76285.1 Metalloprotease PmbA [Buchnera aphidicola (Cinara strobi)]